MKEETTHPIDVFYVLNGGKNGEFWYIDEAFETYNGHDFEPHIFDYDGVTLQPHEGHSLERVISAGREGLDPKNVALIVDDSWETGMTIRETVAYLENIGYERGKIFVFHYFGSGAYGPSSQFNSEKIGFVRNNPVLVSAITMLNFFDNPGRYE